MNEMKPFEEVTEKEWDSWVKISGSTVEQVQADYKAKFEEIAEMKRITAFVDTKLEEIEAETGIRPYLIGVTSEANVEDREVFQRRVKSLSHIEVLGLKQLIGE